MSAAIDYTDFINRKSQLGTYDGFEPVSLPDFLFDFQKALVEWAIRKGRAAIFADCGLGKTPMQLVWADNVVKHTGGRVLILAPLAVSQQTAREGEKFRIDVKYARSQNQSGNGITITNYEMLEKFDPDLFDAVVLDESSILKSFDGKMRTQVIERFYSVPFKLACTATPAPNDFMELGNHCEFLNVLKRQEMLTCFFVHDGGDTGKWRLKGHAEEEYWKWLCSWAVMLRKPSDLGFEDKDFILPKLKMHSVKVKATNNAGFLFPMEAQTLPERLGARRETAEDRAKITAEMVNDSRDTWLIWCNLNSESELLHKYIPDSKQIKGSDSLEYKEQTIKQFSGGDLRVLITKPSIAGFGMNWQHCHKMAFVGLSDSYEQFYQAVRRCWRFGQKNEVDCYIVTADIEGAVVGNIQRKEKDAMRMAANMVKHMHVYNESDIKKTGRIMTENQYKTRHESGKGWDLYLGDSCEVIKQIPDNSIHYSIFSPPFASLFTYTNLPQDMGNSKNEAEFYEHFRYLIADLYRVIMPGRLLSFHCMNLPSTIQSDGFIGIKDFRGDLIRLFQNAGFIYHSEVCIWKDPLVQATRTKTLALAHKQIVKDSAMCGQGLPDYLITMRKPGANPEPISHPNGFTEYVGEAEEPSKLHITNNPKTNKFSHIIWQRYASPVWFDIRQTNTLQHRSAREHKDEKHICPLQLDVIRRALELWTNPGDTVLSPFAGIGSEGYVALESDRKFIGIELKESYFKQAAANLKQVVNNNSLFDGSDIEHDADICADTAGN